MRDLCEVEFLGGVFWRGKVLGLARWKSSAHPLAAKWLTTKRIYNVSTLRFVASWQIYVSSIFNVQTLLGHQAPVPASPNRYNIPGNSGEVEQVLLNTYTTLLSI